MTLKTTADSARREDEENAAKLKRSMENVETRAGLRTEGRLKMVVSPNQPSAVPEDPIEIDGDNASILEEEFRLPKNSGPYAPVKVRAIPVAPSAGIASREFFNSSAGQKSDGQKRRRENDEEYSKTGLTHNKRNGTFNRPEPGNRNRDLISKIDNGNDIITSNIGRLQTILDKRTERTNLATTGQVLSNVGSFINSVRPNMRLLQRAEDVGNQFLDQIINQAGLSRNN